MTLQSLVKFALSLVLIGGALAASSQTRTEPKVIAAQLFIAEGMAQLRFNVHIDDLKNAQQAQSPISAITTHMPNIGSCVFSSAKAQDNFIKPVQPITDTTIDELSDDYLTFIAFWQCNTQPDSIDASNLFDELPSVESMFVSIITDDPATEPELPLQINRGQASTSF